MAYEVLARKWRPQVFEDVIGQDHIIRTLRNAIKADRLAHAYLFSGARGVGKTSVARILAKAMNCREGEPDIPCNKCHSCLEIMGGSSVDVQEIDGASNRGIDEIRELRENIKYMPSSNSFRVYIIDEVHMLTLQAFNALLKTLEEPPPHVKFLFATTEPHKVPVTILSRCQQFDFKRIPVSQIVKQLETITGQEGVDINRSGLGIIAREAEGSMRDAESLLDQVISYTGLEVEDKNITDILGIIDRALIFETSLAIIDGSPIKCIEIVDRIYNYGYDLKEFYKSLMDQFRNLLVSLIAPQSDLFDMIASDVEETKRQAQMAGLERLQQSLQLLISQEEDIRFTFQPKLVLETIMIRLCRLGEDLSFDELIKKIEVLEERLMSSSSGLHQLPMGRLSEPGGNWESEKKEVAHCEKISEKSTESDWEQFLEYLSSKSQSMSNVLKEWRLLKLTDDSLEMAKGNSSFSAGYLDDPDRFEKLVGFCRDYFKRNIKIKVLDNGADHQGGKTPSEKSRLSDDRRPVQKKNNDAGLPPHVHDVLQIFQGKINEEVSGNGSEEPRPKVEASSKEKLNITI